MTDRRLREDVARAVYRSLGHEDTDPWDEALDRRGKFGVLVAYSANQETCFEIADAVLAIPAIRDALNFHSACLSRLEQGDFYVTKDSMGSNGKHWGE